MQPREPANTPQGMLQCRGRRPGRNGLAMALCIVVVFGAGLRAYALDFQSLWTDEISSLMITDPTLPFRQFWDRVLTDTHPPIYYLVLRWSSSAFGQSEIVARAPSVLFGILTVFAAGILPGASLSKSTDQGGGRRLRDQ